MAKTIIAWFGYFPHELAPCSKCGQQSHFAKIDGELCLSCMMGWTDDKILP